MQLVDCPIPISDFFQLYFFSTFFFHYFCHVPVIVVRSLSEFGVCGLLFLLFEVFFVFEAIGRLIKPYM